MKLYIVKALGTFHGLFGIFVLVFLWASYSQGFFDDIGIGRTVLKVTGSAVGAILLVLCMWASWRNPALAALYAWLSPLWAYSVEKLCFEMSGDFICDLSGIAYCLYEGVAEVA